MNIYNSSKYAFATLLILFSISFVYTWYNWANLQNEFKDYSIFDVSMILLFRATINIFASVFVTPFAIAKQLCIGAVNCTVIVIDEMVDALQILQKIFENWFVRWVWDKIIIVMNTIGRFLEPYFTYFVRLLIYILIFTGITTSISLFVYLVYCNFLRLKKFILQYFYWNLYVN